MIPTLDKDYRANYLFIFVAWVTTLLENKKKAVIEKQPCTDSPPSQVLIIHSRIALPGQR